MLPDYARQYRRLWSEHWWWQSRTGFVLRHVERIARHKPLTRILDIGCGDALMFEGLSRHGEVWGIEPDGSLIDPGNPHRERIRVCPFDEQYEDGRRYDLVLMLDVLEHIEDDRATLRHVYRLLNPGGCVVVTVPALQLLWSRHDVVNRHFRRYTRRELRDRLAEAGLHLDRVGYYFGWTVGPMLIRRVIASGSSGDDAASHDDDYNVAIPGRPINALIRAFTAVEHRIAAWKGLPIGSSVFAIARRPNDQETLA